MRDARTRHLVRFSDCDPMGHLNNAKYMEYFLNAREDQLREYYNFDIYRYTRKTGNAWIAIRNQISYFREAAVMEEVLMESRLINFEGSKSRVEMLMFDKDATHVKSHLWADFLFINASTKSVIPHTEDVIKFFTPFLEPVEEKSFDERTAYLRKWRADQEY